MTMRPIRIDQLSMRHSTVFVRTVIDQYQYSGKKEWHCHKAFILDVAKVHGEVAAYEIAKFLGAKRRTLTKWIWEMKERPESSTARLYGTLPKADAPPAHVSQQPHA